MAWRDDAEPYPKKTLIGLGIALQSLKDQRIISDYKLEATISELDSQVAIKTAEKLLNRCAEMVKTKAS